MAMTKPIVMEVNAFDASTDHTFYFTSSGGNQVVKNEIKIIDNDTNEPMYQNMVETYQFNQTVPKGTLSNGKQYAVAFRTYGVNENDISAWSNYLPFYCYSTPTLTLNITNNQIIKSSSFELTIDYNQQELELLSYAIVELYDANTNILVNKSEELYSTSEPPLRLFYQLNGLENDKNYKIKVKALTVNSTSVETDFIRFNVRYKFPPSYAEVSVKPYNCDGYVNITANYVVIDGHYPSYLSHIKYIDNEKIDLRGCDHNINHHYYGSYVKWNSGFTVSKDVLIRLWFSPACIQYFDADTSTDYYHISEGVIFESVGAVNTMGGSDYIRVTYKRGEEHDYLVIETNYGTNITKQFAHMNGTENMFLWIKVVGDKWDVRLEVNDAEETVFNWNEESNLSWNVTTDKTWADEPTFENYVPKADVQRPLHYEMDNVTIGNGLFDHINITKDTNCEYSNEYPSWDYQTILDCDFNGNVAGGNLPFELKDTSKIKLKRKEKDSVNWITIFEQNVKTIDDVNINTRDYLVPTNIEQTYAFVPLSNSGVEGEYITVKATPQWQGTFITDGDKIFKLLNAVVYDNTTQNVQNGSLVPIGSKYPVVIQNGESNYKNGAMSCQLCGYKFDKNKQIDRNDVVKQTNDFLNFLTNGKLKGLVDWNGNAIVFRVVSSPSASYNSYYGNGITNVGFSWVEQGKYDDTEILKEFGLAI